MLSFHGLASVGWLVFGVIVTAACPLVSSSRILLAVPLTTTRSHYMNLRLVMGALADRGHEVTFLMSAANLALSHEKTALEASFRFTLYRGPWDAAQLHLRLHRFMEEVTKTSTWDDRRAKYIMEASLGDNYASTANPWRQTAMEFDSILGNETLIAALKRSSYDLLIGDPAANLCPPLLAEVLSVPFIQYSLQGLRVMRHDRWFGQTIHPSYMPVSIMQFCDAMSFQERVINWMAYAVSRYLIDRNNLAPFESVKTKHQIRPEVSLSNLLLKSRLHLVNANVHVQEFALPVLPNLIPVGGVTAEPAQPLEENLEAFFDGSGRNGVVVISMGTSLGFDEERMRDIAGALSRLKQRVVWMLRGTRPPNLGNNTKIVQWLPLNDVLGHPKTRVLVNHGGTSTVLEAIYHGVPMVLIPLANDMFDITARAVCRGVAVRLNMPTVTGSSLREAVQRVISEPSFQERSSHFAAVMKATKPSPLETAVFWIEHVLKYGGEYLRPASAQNSPFYKSALLDVFLVFVVGCAVVVKMLSYFCRKSLALFSFLFW